MSFSPVGRAAGAAFVAAGGASLIGVAVAWPSHAMQLFNAGTAAGVLAAITVRMSLRAPVQRVSRLDVGLFVGAIVAQVIAMSVILPRLHGDLGQIWLATLVIAAVHFIPMGRPFGRWIVLMGTACLVLVGLAYLAPFIPIQMVVATDGVLKICVGTLAATYFWQRSTPVVGANA